MAPPSPFQPACRCSSSAPRSPSRIWSRDFAGNINPGDVFLTNDPYHGGHNCHLPDWGYIRPIFYQGRAVVLHPVPRPPDGYRRLVPGRLLPQRLRHPRRGAHHPADQGVRSRARAHRRRQSDPQQRALPRRRAHRSARHDRLHHHVREAHDRAARHLRQGNRAGLRQGDAGTYRAGGARGDPQDSRWRLYRRRRHRRRWHRARRAGLGARARHRPGRRDDHRLVGERRPAPRLRQQRLRRHLRQRDRRRDPMFRSSPGRLPQPGNDGVDQSHCAARLGGELPIPRDGRRLAGQCRHPGDGGGARGAVEGGAASLRRRLGASIAAITSLPSIRAPANAMCAPASTTTAAAGRCGASTATRA